MKKAIKISAVSYLNSRPFIYGIRESKGLGEYSLELDIPSVCSEKLLADKVDIGLVPVATIPGLKYHKILTDHCIGADGAVDSVVLYSEVPIEKVEKIWLDYQSKTSVTLIQILVKKYWKIGPQFIKAEKGYEEKIVGITAGVVIGDRTFALKNKFKYTYDLAEEWKKFTGLPFVFACWVANKPLPEGFENEFSEAIKQGVENRKRIIYDLKKEYPNLDVSDYLMNKIGYNLDDKKKKVLSLFLEYMKELN